MAFNFDWGLFQQSQDRKNQNRLQANQDISGLGQSFGQSLTSIGDIIGDQKKKAILQKLMAAMQGQGAPQQGPQLAPAGTPQPNLTQIPPGQPMSAGSGIGQDVQMPQPIPTQTPGEQPTSGMGAPAQDNSKLIQSLLIQYDPQTAIRNMPVSPSLMNPLQQSEIARNLADAKKAGNPPSEWAPIPGQISKAGKTLFYNKTTREEKEGDIPVSNEKSTEKSDKIQEGLEKQFADRIQRVVATRSGGLGMQDQKVDQAIHLRAMINQAWNPQTKTYELPEMQQGELVMGLANLVSGNSVGNIEQLRSITPKTASGDMNHMISYWTGKPLTNQPQEMIKNLITSIDRQGQVAEKLRDKYMSGLKMLRPKDLDKDRADALMNASLTSSYSDTLKDSPDQSGSSGGLTPEEQAEFSKLDAKYGGKK